MKSIDHHKLFKMNNKIMKTQTNFCISIKPESQLIKNLPKLYTYILISRFQQKKLSLQQTTFQFISVSDGYLCKSYERFIIWSFIIILSRILQAKNYKLIIKKEIKCIHTNGKVTTFIVSLESISFCRFWVIALISLPSTKPAPTNSLDIPSAESLPTANSKRMSFNSRLTFLWNKKY